MRTINVNVEEKHIQKALKLKRVDPGYQEWKDCPIALAVQEKLERNDVEVFEGRVEIGVKETEEENQYVKIVGETCTVSEEIEERIICFDKTEDMEPFTFELYLNDE